MRSIYQALQRVAKQLTVSAVCSVLLVVRADAQTIVRSFDGDTGPVQERCNTGELRCGRQAEMAAAANGKQVLQVTWQHVNIYDYNGKLLHSTTLPDFIRNAGLDPIPRPPSRPGVTDHGPFEPHIVFDEFIGRWIMTATCLNDCFMVSASADAAGAWRGVYLSCLQGGPCLNADPALQIGYDKNGVYYCGGHLGDENPHTIRGVAYDCFAIPPAEVKAVAQGKEPAHVNRRHNMVMHVRPAVDQNPRKAANAPALFAARSCSRAEPGGCQRAVNFPFEWIVTPFIWHGATGSYGSDQALKTAVGSRQNRWLYNTLCCGQKSAVPQAGSAIEVRAAESHRLNNLVQSGSHLEIVFASGPCTHDCGAQGADTNNVMFWADVDCSDSAACTVDQTAKIASGEINPLFPTIGVDNQGNVGIVAASASSAAYLSILLWTHRAADPGGVITGPMTVVSGTKPYTCPNNLNLALIASAVGMMTVQDPLDRSRLWTTHQYAADATACVWNSRIIEYRPGAGDR